MLLFMAYIVSAQADRYQILKSAGNSGRIGMSGPEPRRASSQADSLTQNTRDRVLIERADLPPNQPAIDRDDRAGHIIGQVGSKELDHFGTILDGSEPTKGNQLGSIPITLNAARNDPHH